MARVEAAARIDFGGGWTDTPPYSIERGGTVLNAAMTLRGARPIVAEAGWLPNREIVLMSRDIDEVLRPQMAGDVLDYRNPADPFALIKAALVLKGIVPEDAPPHTRIADLLSDMPGGIQIATQTSIPRGSGLGTSSIMAGAVLASLDRVAGKRTDQAELFDQVLCLEQMMTTGGGWQDQVGGLVGGVKLVTTQPGLPQQIEVEPIADDVLLPLRERLCLVYTGQQRLAKNLLRAVMIRWMARDPEMVWILGEIGRLALEMERALQRSDIDQFGGLVREHWLLNKRMDPGCTNPFIDELFEFLDPYMTGGEAGRGRRRRLCHRCSPQRRGDRGLGRSAPATIRRHAGGCLAFGHRGGWACLCLTCRLRPTGIRVDRHLCSCSSVWLDSTIHLLEARKHSHAASSPAFFPKASWPSAIHSGTADRRPAIRPRAGDILARCPRAGQRHP